MSVQNIPGPSNIGKLWVWLLIFAVVAVYATTRGKQRKSRSRRRRGGGGEYGMAALVTAILWIAVGFLSTTALKLTVVDIVAVAVLNFFLVLYLVLA